MNILILMAGESSDFAEKGYKFPKYLIEIHNKPIIQRIMESLQNLSKDVTCIIRKQEQEQFYLSDTLKILSENCNVIEINDKTKGAVCTALFGIDKINNDEELLILNGDQFIKSDIKPAIDDFRKRDLDGGIITMEAVNPKYSTVMLDENNLVVQTSEKRPISKIASTGCSYYKHGSDFVEAAFNVIEKDVNTQGSYYISSTFNEMILKQKKIGVYQIPKKDYISFSTYQMYENFMTQGRFQTNGENA
jgi:NDP-sugar pyrophosphorylase family protein